MTSAVRHCSASASKTQVNVETFAHPCHTINSSNNAEHNVEITTSRLGGIDVTDLTSEARNKALLLDGFVKFQCVPGFVPNTHPYHLNPTARITLPSAGAVRRQNEFIDTTINYEDVATRSPLTTGVATSNIESIHASYYLHIQ